MILQYIHIHCWLAAQLIVLTPKDAFYAQCQSPSPSIINVYIQFRMYSSSNYRKSHGQADVVYSTFFFNLGTNARKINKQFLKAGKKNQDQNYLDGWSESSDLWTK